MFLCIYSGLQLDEIKAAIFDLNAVGDIDLRVWYQIKPVLLTIAILTAVFAVANSFISWKLYYEFAWALFKFVQADIVLRRRYLIFQCYVALLKFDLFFFAGFLVQLVIIVYKTNIEWTITLCVIPVSIFSLVAGSFVTRRESYYGSFTVMTIHFALLGFYVFKMSQMYSKNYAYQYLVGRNILTYFAATTILLVVVTIAAHIMCIVNFGKGLKPYVAGDRWAQELTDQYEEGREFDEDGTYALQMTGIDDRPVSVHRPVSRAS